ncbi:hypothetical protein ABC347_13160 [Sphingomonas sp. 1P06PA]
MTRLSASPRSRRALCASAALAFLLAGVMQGGQVHATPVVTAAD